MKLVTIKLLTPILLIAMMLTSHLTHADSKKIIKWVDGNGVTHYGDKPPMPDKANQSTVLNKQGVTIDQTSNKVEKEVAIVEEEGASATQKRYDRALLATYASIEEIELARKRNVRIDELTLEELKQRRRHMQTESAEHFDKVALQKMEQRIRDQQKIITNINKRYENDKKRFTELKASASD